MLESFQLFQEQLGWLRYHFLEMTFFYILYFVFNNGSYVDFGWPFGFTSMAIYYLYTTPSSTRTYLITIPFILAGLRFMFGWSFGRKHHLKEDRRWNLWRKRWSDGQGWFGIKSIGLNFFFFYHAQSLFNCFFMSIPLILMTKNNSPINWNEYAGLALWFISFAIENISDVQLSKFKLKNKNSPVLGVCKEGLWYYSRHPNYFGEFLISVSYFLMSISSARNNYEILMLALMVFFAYYFLVHFTGVWISEQGSVGRRGQEYIDYQNTTNIIIPWFPKNLKSN